PAAGAPSPDAVLKDVLGLSDAQLTQLHALLEARRSATESLVSQMQTAQKALQDALGAASPDPAAVGAALLQLQSLQKQIQAAGEAFRTQFTGILTDDQKAKLAQIDALDAALRAGQALHALGLS